MKEYSHDELAVKAGTWLHSKTSLSGMRSEFEVSLAQGYVADYVSICWLQGRFMERYGGIGGGWIKEEIEPGCDVLRPMSFPRARSLVLVFEAKATRSDFLCTFNNTAHHANRHEPIGSLHWCVANVGICDQSVLPDFWGLLVPSGRGLKEIRRPKFNDIEQEFVASLAYQLLWKREYSRHDKILRELSEAVSEPKETSKLD